MKRGVIAGFILVCGFCVSAAVTNELLKVDTSVADSDVAIPAGFKENKSPQVGDWSQIESPISNL